MVCFRAWFPLSAVLVISLFTVAHANSQCLTDADCVNGSQPLVCHFEPGAAFGNCADSYGRTCNCVSACSAGQNSTCYTTTTKDEWQYCSSCNEWDGYDQNNVYCPPILGTPCTDDATCYQDLPCSLNAGCTYYCANRPDSDCECQTACTAVAQPWCFTSTDGSWEYCSQCSPQDGIYGTSTLYSPCVQDSDCASDSWICYQNGVCGTPQQTYSYCKYYYCGEGDGNCDSDAECVGDLVCGKKNCDPQRYPEGSNCCFRSSATTTNSASSEEPTKAAPPNTTSGVSCSEATCADLTPCNKLSAKEVNTKKGCGACDECQTKPTLGTQTTRQPDPLLRTSTPLETVRPAPMLLQPPAPCEWWSC